MAHLLQSSRIYLRDVRPNDIDSGYLSWMNDEQVVRFTEARYSAMTRETLARYIEDQNRDATSIFLAIIARDGDKHIGNIKIGPIDMRHRYGDIGIIIGEKQYWGRGYATEAIKTLVDFCFKAHNLNKITAGCYEQNLGSIKAFQKAGFEIEYTIRKQVLFEERYIDIVKLCTFNPGGVRSNNSRM